MNSFQCGHNLTHYICSSEGKIFKTCNSATIRQLFLFLPVKSLNVITDATCLTLHWHYLQQRKGKNSPFHLPSSHSSLVQAWKGWKKKKSRRKSLSQLRFGAHLCSHEVLGLLTSLDCSEELNSITCGQMCAYVEKLVFQ